MPKSWYNMTPAKAGGGGAEILLYDVIGAWGISAKQFAEDLKNLSGASIDLRINSPGGDVMDGTAIYNMLKADGRHITVHVDGLAASMASVIAMAGHKVVMPANALMMIHNPWTLSMGDADQLRKDADLLDKIKGQIVGAYEAKCGDKKKREELIEMMSAETWLDGNEAVEAGLADECSEVIKAAACAVDVSKFAAKVDSRLAALMPKDGQDVSASANSTQKVEPVSSAVLLDAAVVASRIESERAQAHAEGAASRDAEVKSLRDEIAAAKAEVSNMAAKITTLEATVEAERKARKMAEQAHQTLLGGVKFTPDGSQDSWKSLVDKHGYENARKLYPAAYEAFMQANAPGLKQARK